MAGKFNRFKSEKFDIYLIDVYVLKQYVSIFEILIHMVIDNDRRLFTRISFWIFMAVLACSTQPSRFVQISRNYIFAIFRIDYIFFRFTMLYVLTGPVVIFRSQHLCLGTICVAYWKGRLFTNHIIMAFICLYWSITKA